MVAWLKRQIQRLFGGKGVVVEPVEQICPSCGQVVPAKEVDTFDYENWTPEPAPPDKVEQADQKMDHVFSAGTYYHVASRPARDFDQYPGGEGNPEDFAILRSSRKLPDQSDENGRCRQLDLDKLEELADKCYLLTAHGESPLENVFDADRLSDEEWESLWLEGKSADEAYWAAKMAEVAAPTVNHEPETLNPELKV